MTTTTNLTQIIQTWREGDKQAENNLYQFAYLELRELAQHERRRNAKKYGSNNNVLADSVNNTTTLIHDAYIKLSKSELVNIKTKRDFFLMVTKIMRQILIDNARLLQAKKRQSSTVTDTDTDTSIKNDKFEQLIIVDKALDNFSVRYPRQSNALKLKYLMGMKNHEISQLLRCSPSLIEKDLKFSRSWLQRYMAG